MELQGKKAVFLGDSITEGHGTSGAEHIRQLDRMGLVS